MRRSRRTVSFETLNEYLLRIGPLPFSFLHPAGLLLFSDRLTYFLWETVSSGEILLAETEDGVLFLPLPPARFFSPDLSALERGILLSQIFREIAKEEETRPLPFLLNCPLGLLPEGSFRIDSTDAEFLIRPASLLFPRGSNLRALRWEKNRFVKDHPHACIRPFEASDRASVSDFSSQFSKRRTDRSFDDLEKGMAQDMDRAFGRAMDLWEEGGLEGFILEEKGAILGLEWVGIHPLTRTLICFLEARAEGVSNVGSAMMQRILEASGNGADWVNVQGGSEVKGVARSKRMRPHDLVLPLFRVVPEGESSGFIEKGGEDLGGFGKIR